MNFIPTTATAAEKLKLLAKKQRKESGTSLAVALNVIAKANGYVNWRHVTQCLEQSKSAPKAAAALPQPLASFLAEASNVAKLSADAMAAFRVGFVFAMDVKDAENVDLGDEFVDCDEAWMLAAVDIWRAFVHAKNDETDTALVDRLDEDDLVLAAQEDFMNYRLFRYTGASVPTSLDDAFARVLGRFFFPPTHIWLKGQFIDMEDVREIRIKGRVVYSTTTAGQEGKSLPPLSPGHNVLEQPQAAVVSESIGSRCGIIPRLDIFKLEPCLYEYRLSYGGQEMMTDAGFSTIREAIESAADVTGNIRGFEVAYAGLTVGTYPLTELRSSAEVIAQQAVTTVAALHDY